jgi:cysteinyl-tRNA synthetase
MQALYELIKDANIHISAHKSDADMKGLESIARWVTKIVCIFGLDANASPPYEGLGWAISASISKSTPEETVEPYRKVYLNVKNEVEKLDLKSDAITTLLAVDVDSEFKTVSATGTKDPEKLANPYLRLVSKTRDELRKLAPTSTQKKTLLLLSDRIRDEDLFNLGVYLDDRSVDQGALIKHVPKSELLAQREEKASKEREKLALKEKARLEKEKLDQEKAEKAKLNPLDMFKDDRFSAWDNEGMPTKTKEGEDVPKSALKKLKKEWERQKKAHEEWKAKNGGAA